MLGHCSIIQHYRTHTLSLVAVAFEEEADFVKTTNKELAAALGISTAPGFAVVRNYPGHEPATVLFTRQEASPGAWVCNAPCHCTCPLRLRLSGVQLSLVQANSLFLKIWRHFSTESGCPTGWNTIWRGLGICSSR